MMKIVKGWKYFVVCLLNMFGRRCVVKCCGVVVLVVVNDMGFVKGFVLL